MQESYHWTIRGSTTPTIFHHLDAMASHLVQLNIRRALTMRALLTLLLSASAAFGQTEESLDALTGFVDQFRSQPASRSALADAIRKAERLEGENPGLFRAVFVHAQLLYLDGRFEGTLAALGRVKPTDRNADYFNLAGMSYAGLNDLATASRAVLHAIQLAPERADLLVNLAGLYQRARNNTAALEALRKAVGMPTASAETYFALALTHYNLGNFEASVEQCQQAVKRHTRFDKAFLLMGRAYGRLAKGAEATAALRQAASLDPACDACRFELALLASASESERLLRETLAINPNHAGAHFRLGKLLGERKQTGEAVTELERAIALDPEMDSAYYQLGVLYRQKGEADKSREILAALRARKERRRAATEAGLAAAKPQ